MVNTNALKAKYVSKGMTQAQTAELIGITAYSFRDKVNNRRDFKSSEIANLIQLLDIADDEIKPIFFTEEVAKTASFET